MAIFKIHKNDDFAIISKHHLRNKELSLKAKGLLSIMLSLPDDWDYSILGLKALSKDGRDAVMSAIDELEKHGYLETTTTRNDLGRFETLYDVFDDPGRKNRIGKPESENPTQYNNINKEHNNYTTPLSPKGEKKKEGLDLGFIAPEYMEAIQKWLAYKKEKRQTYKQSGLNQCYRHLIDLSNGNAELAMEIVNQSIANNYSGLFALKQNAAPKMSFAEKMQKDTQEIMQMAFEMHQMSANSRKPNGSVFDLPT